MRPDARTNVVWFRDSLSVCLYVGGVFLHVAPCGGRGEREGLGPRAGAVLCRNPTRGQWEGTLSSIYGVLCRQHISTTRWCPSTSTYPTFSLLLHNPPYKPSPTNTKITPPPTYHHKLYIIDESADHPLARPYFIHTHPKQHLDPLTYSSPITNMTPPVKQDHHIPTPPNRSVKSTPYSPLPQLTA